MHSPVEVPSGRVSPLGRRLDCFRSVRDHTGFLKFDKNEPHVFRTKGTSDEVLFLSGIHRRPVTRNDNYENNVKQSMTALRVAPNPVALSMPTF